MVSDLFERTANREVGVSRLLENKSDGALNRSMQHHSIMRNLKGERNGTQGTTVVVERRESRALASMEGRANVDGHCARTQ
jgi:hypothetical protein